MQLNITLWVIEQMNGIFFYCECIGKILVSGKNQKAHVNASKMEYKINNVRWITSCSRYKRL